MRMLVMVEGRGFRGTIDGRSLKLGFVANRAVVATTVQTIDKDALFAQVKDELLASGIEALPQASMRISRTSLRRDDDLAEYKGFSFYREGRMNVEREWWHRLGTLTLTIVSAVYLFKAAGIKPLTGPTASIVSWVIFCVCAYGLQNIYDVLFDFATAIVKRRRRAAGGT
jgi:hypothetical protein